MSTLQENLQQRRTAELPQSLSSNSAEAPGRALQIHSWNGETWVFPWSHFSAARHQGTGESEQLVLSFANHEVVVDGVRLLSLLPEIAGFRLDSLRSLPTKYEPQGNGSEPFVKRLSVRPVGKPAAVETAHSVLKKPDSSNDDSP